MVYLISITNLCHVDFCEKEPLLRMPHTGKIILLAFEIDTALAECPLNLAIYIPDSWRASLSIEQLWSLKLQHEV